MLGRIYTDLNKDANKRLGDKADAAAKEIYAQFPFLVHYCLSQLNEEYLKVGERVKGKEICPACKGSGKEGSDVCPTCHGIGVVDSSRKKTAKNESISYENKLIQESLKLFESMRKK